MTGLFISYSRKDSVVARKLIQEFKTIDIEQADAFIFLVSPDSAASEVCKVEVEHARKNHKRIIPIVTRNVEPKNVVPTIASDPLPFD